MEKKNIYFFIHELGPVVCSGDRPRGVLHKCENKANSVSTEIEIETELGKNDGYLGKDIALGVGDPYNR